MAAQDIEYVELYTSDERSAVEYFVSSFGFKRTAESSANGSHSSLLLQGTAQLIVTAGQGTEEFLEAHGDGVVDIAFACDDAAQDRDRAVAEGASVITSEPNKQVVSGFFGVQHTLVTRRATRVAPPDRTWTPVADDLVRPAGHIQLLDHVAICVDGGTLTDCADFYTSAFGFPRYSSEYIEVGDQAMDSIVVRSTSGGVTFTILEQDTDKKSGQVEAFLSRNGGPGVQHLAFLVDDIVSAVHAYRDHGIDFLRTPGSYYEMLAERFPSIRADIKDLRETDVLADCDEWGYLLQLFTRSPYRRNTMFYELVQRRGARGFGSSNIKALYEAVERDGLAAG
ncbi:MAG: 4-hydroxyphenylpyruvate dioxygenase [Streptosporangiaceae bacterium]